MEAAIAVRDDFKVTATDVRKYFAPNATDKEFGILMGICKSFNLNPFKREVHFIKYGNSPASVIVGYEVYLKRAESTGQLDGWRCWIEKDEIGEKAVIEIKRKDQTVPIKWEVYRKEFDRGQASWKTMPLFLLRKVAISQGMRLAFPGEIGGLPYTAEELPREMGGGTSEALPQGDVHEAEEAKPDPRPHPRLVDPPPVADTADDFDAPAEQEENVRVGQVMAIESKEGETKGKPWTLFGITVGTERFKTFSDTFCDLARTAKEQGKDVRVEFKPGPKGNTLTGIEITETYPPQEE